MPAVKDKSHFHYAERIRARLPRVLQALREAAGLSRYALEQRCGVTREMIDRIEKGKSKHPSLCLLAQLSHGLGLKITEFTRRLEDGAAW